MHRATLTLLALVACADADPSPAPPPEAPVAPSPPPPPPAPDPTEPPTPADPAPPDATADATSTLKTREPPTPPTKTEAPPATDSTTDSDPTADSDSTPDSDSDSTTDSDSDSDSTTDSTTDSDSDSTPDSDSDSDSDSTPDSDSPKTYALTRSTSLVVQVFKDPDTVAAGLSHDHVIRGTRPSGTLTWDPTSPTACRISVDLPVASLVVDTPKLRAAYGLEGTLSDKQRSDVAKNMRSKKQLWADRHSRITFRSTACTATGEGALRVTGDLSVRGQTARKTVTLSLTEDGDRLTAAGRFQARATEFGFDPYTALAGALRNQDQMTFHVSLVGEAR